MKRKLLVTFSVVFLIALWGVHSACAQPTSPHGLKLVTFSVNPSQASAGGNVTVAFRLRNTTNHPITFSP